MIYTNKFKMRIFWVTRVSVNMTFKPQIKKDNNFQGIVPILPYEKLNRLTSTLMQFKKKTIFKLYLVKLKDDFAEL